MTLRGTARQVVERVLPSQAHAWLARHANGGAPAPRPQRVEFGSFRRLDPIGHRWGKDRGGLPIDRYYIEGFLAAHAADVRGRVLEVGDDRYTIRFGGDAVERRDVLHLLPGNPAATIVADLTRGDHIPSDAFDCVILTQTLHVLPDPGAAMRTVHRILKPGGVLLASMPGISQISRWDMERWGDYWRFTSLSAQALAAAVFPPALVTVGVHGNVLTAIAFLHGLAAQELGSEELDYEDPDFQLIITVRAVRPVEDR
jgi:SAM-dependent methyltransferase